MSIKNTLPSFFVFWALSFGLLAPRPSYGDGKSPLKNELLPKKAIAPSATDQKPTPSGGADSKETHPSKKVGEPSLPPSIEGGKHSEGEANNPAALGVNPLSRKPELILDPPGLSSGQGVDGELTPREPKTFIRGEKIEDLGRSERVRYVYLSRGVWLIDALQPLLDELGEEVLRLDAAEPTANYLELVRSYAFLCRMLLNDDGTERSGRKIASAIASHRRALSLLRLSWVKKPRRVALIFNRYMDITFMRNIESVAREIPVGTLGEDGYRPYAEEKAAARNLKSSKSKGGVFEKFLKEEDASDEGSTLRDGAKGGLDKAKDTLHEALASPTGEGIQRDIKEAQSEVRDLGQDLNIIKNDSVIKKDDRHRP